jgi:hypothetical protein
MSFIAVPQSFAVPAYDRTNALLNTSNFVTFEIVAADSSGTASADPGGSLLMDCI